MNSFPLNVFTCMSLGDYVRNLVSPVVLVSLQLSSSFSKRQRNGETHSKFVNSPL